MKSVGQGSAPSNDDIGCLREKHYNATLAAVLPVHSEVRIIRVIPDGGVPQFIPGQYFTLGLGNWEARVPGVDEEQIDAAHWSRLSKRAYSASCSILDESGELRRPAEFPYLEFYVALVRHAQRHPPALTPRLFAMQALDRLFVSPHAVGRYTLSAVRPGDNVFFFATGTGEAPQNAMIAELLARGHQGNIVSAASVRYLRDAAYRTPHEELARRFPHFHYFLLATRETEPSHRTPRGLRGSRHLQDAVRGGALERESGVSLDPANSHIFLCGSPAMIGISPPSSAGDSAFAPGSMVELLLCRGFSLDEPDHPGNIHFERYW